MTIKEVEQLTGMTRANIRFYESEGLIIPTRNENGYRSYSERDVDELNKIRLLRTLNVSLEDIKRIKNGELTLGTFMESHLDKLKKQEELLKRSWDVCSAIRDDDVTFSTLNAGKYLQLLEAGNIEQDVLEKNPMIWRRFWARTLDLAVCATIWFSFVSIVANTNIAAFTSTVMTLQMMVVFVFMLLIEPICISRFGTTLGKWILGLYIYDDNDLKMDYATAAKRTFDVIRFGYGFNIPIYNWYRLYKNFSILSKKQELPWETESVIVLKDKKVVRNLVYVVAIAAVFGVLALSMKIAEIPKHQGEVTVEEFKENYDKLLRYHGLEHKQFNQDFMNPNGFVIEVMEEPTISLEEENGLLKVVNIELVRKNGSSMISSCQTEMILSVISFMRANESGLFPSPEVETIISYINENPFKSFSFKENGYIIKCDVEYENYIILEGTHCISKDKDNSYYSMIFNIEKIGD